MWALLLDNGELVAPSELLSASVNAIPESSRLEFEGGEHPFVRDSVQRQGRLAFFSVGTDAADPSKLWPTGEIRAADQPENCLIVSGTQDSHLPLPAARISKVGPRWQVDPSFTINPEWQGASVIATDDGSLLGLLLFEKGQTNVELIKAR